MKILISDFVQFSGAFARFLALEERLGTRLYLHSNLGLF